MTSRELRGRTLPAEVTSFIGRRHELAAARQGLASARLVTLIGPGGVGKTRLAIRLAERVSREFRDGVYFVDLSELTDPESLVETVALSLGLRDRSGGWPDDSLADFVADRELLVVLDNCEHVIDLCGALVARLLSIGKWVRIVATSRQPLEVRGEHLVAVPPLSMPATERDIAAGDLRHFDAVALFAERTEAMSPGFRVDACNPALVARLCQLLDGLPLAIELAATRMRALSLEQVVARLDDPFSVLSSGFRGAPPRQRSLYALVHWSYELCTPEQRLVWARLSVFEGSFDIQIARDVCSLDAEAAPAQFLDVVSGLVDKSVLVVEEADGRQRYRMLELHRAYGATRLAERGEKAVLLERHRDRYGAFVAAADDAWFGPGQHELIAVIAAEQANLRLAFETALSEPATHRLALFMAYTLRFYWIFAGFIHEGRRWLARALALHLAADDDRFLGLHFAAWLALIAGDADEARRLFAEAATIPVTPAHQARSESSRATLARLDGSLADAVTGYEAAREQYRRAGDGHGEVAQLLFLSILSSSVGEPDRAIAYAEEMVAVCDRHGEEFYQARGRYMLGDALALRGDLGRAHAVALEALELNRRFDQKLLIADVLGLLARISAARTDETRAARLLGARAQLLATMGARGGYQVDLLRDPDRECEIRVRAALGEEAFAAAFDDGHGLGFDQVLALALGRQRREPQLRPESSAAAAAKLSRRELQIAELLARGLSNKEIAHALVISRRTAEGHVERILKKLGLRSRTQVAAWVATARSDTRSGNR